MLKCYEKTIKFVKKHCKIHMNTITTPYLLFMSVKLVSRPE